MGDQAFGQLVLNAHGRIQRRHWFLVDHRDIGSAKLAQFGFGTIAQRFTLEQDFPVSDAAIRPEEIDNRVGRGAFSAARFANQPRFSPRWMLKVTSRTALTSPLRVLYETARFLTDKMGDSSIGCLQD